MTKKQINEKYGIELIGKEMWVWDNHPEDACLSLVMYKSHKSDYPYTIIDKHGNTEFFKYASETKPNETKEPKVGDKGYFWDDETYYAYDVISSIINTNGIKDLLAFNAHFSGNYKNFSHEKQPWMK
jgi:hypothetical protein